MGRKVLLIDTNIFIEMLLNQERAQECRKFLDSVSMSHDVVLTEFTLYSIGIILEGRKQHEQWKRFLSECRSASFILVSSSFSHEEEMIAYVTMFGIDIDDAHQYEAAKRLGADLVSFDADFDQTDLQRTQPKDYL